MTEVILPDWLKKKTDQPEVVLPAWAKEDQPPPEPFQGGVQDRMTRAWQATWEAASDWDKFASDKPLVPTGETVRKYGQRIAMETVPVVATAGEAYRKFRPAGPLAATTAAALTGAGTAIGGAFADRELLGNVLPGDYELQNQLITGLGGAAGVKIPRLPSEVVSEATKRGIRVTPGAAADSRIVRWTQQKIQELPFAGGNLQRAVDEGYADFSRAVDRLVGETSVVPGKATGDFVRETGEALNKKYAHRAGELYDILNRGIDPTQSVRADALRVFAEGAERTGASASFMDDLVRDTLRLFRESENGIPSNQLSWQNLDDIRRKAGRLSDTRTADVDAGMAKQIYKLAKQEQDRIVKELGPAEQKAWRNANRYAKRHAEWKKEALKFVTTGNVEKIWRSLTSNPNASNIQRIISSTGGRGSQAWKEVRAAVLREMGSNPSIPGGFDVVTWTRNYNKIAKDSTAARLFLGDLKKDIDSLAVVARGMAAPSKYSNTSNSATSAVFYALMGSTMAAASGNLKTAAALAAPSMGAFIGDVLLSRPWAIKLLAKGAQVPMSSFRRREVWAKQFAATAAAEGYKEQGEAVADMIMSGDDVPSVPVQPPQTAPVMETTPNPRRFGNQ